MITSTTVRPVPKIRTSHIIRALEEIIDQLEDLDGADTDEIRSAKNNAQAAELTRELLYLDYALRAQAIAVLELYHSFRSARRPRLPRS